MMTGAARVARVLLTLVSLATCQYTSFLAPLNDAGIGLGQVIFLPSLSSHHQHHHHHHQSSRHQRNIQFEDFSSDESEIKTVIEYDENEIGSGRDLVHDEDLIDYSEEVTDNEEVNEEPNSQNISGSYAYTRKQQH